MTEENHEITIKFDSSEELQKVYKELIQKGFNISNVSDYKVVTVKNTESETKETKQWTRKA